MIIFRSNIEGMSASKPLQVLSHVYSRDILSFTKIDATDANDGYKRMWSESSTGKVIEAYLPSVLRCCDGGLPI